MYTLCVRLERHSSSCYDTPARPIVNTRGSPTYNLAQHLAGVIAPLTGKTFSFVKNAPHFVEKVNKLKVPDSTIMVSFDVKSLFTNVPILEALHVIRRQLEPDDTLSSRSTMNTSSIIELLHICLTTTYFSFEGQYYQQNDGAAMGSPLSPIVANIYMEHFEKIAIQTPNKTPSCGFDMCVDDTFSLWPDGPEELSLFLNHINNIRPSIQFTMEVEDDEKIPFLDVLVVRSNGKVMSEVYWKPTHTDRYLHYQSYHPHHIKTGIIRTLMKRSEQICNTAEAAHHERHHLIRVFQSNGYPRAFIQKAMNPKRTYTKDKQAAPLTTISIPYIKSISERIRRCLSQVDIRVAFRSRTTMRSLLMRVRPQRSPMEYKGVIYKIPCHDCDQV